MRASAGEKLAIWMRTDGLLSPGTVLAQDTILVKRHWAQLSGGSEKPFRDALRVYEVGSPALDLAYLNRWADQLGIEAIWRRVQDEARPVVECLTLQRVERLAVQLDAPGRKSSAWQWR